MLRNRMMKKMILRVKNTTKNLLTVRSKVRMSKLTKNNLSLMARTWAHSMRVRKLKWGSFKSRKNSQKQNYLKLSLLKRNKLQSRKFLLLQSAKPRRRLAIKTSWSEKKKSQRQRNLSQVSKVRLNQPLLNLVDQHLPNTSLEWSQ